ncbi:uncharacterized protein LOC114717611 [Neltuma alba]|uniref:uncharacterized protein LOC114717611 n=1 Tax=Neltuma alba TaxID=207710 RepID=UPI0010A34E0E|nr:uncharacterized protein LOC114717611 [Prosopis alba]
MGDDRLLSIREEVETRGVPDYEISEEGILRYKKRICAPNNEKIKKTILEEAYQSNYTIHPRITKMYQDLKKNYWWSKMKKDVTDFKWDNISIDFITGMPRTLAGYDVIWKDSADQAEVVDGPKSTKSYANHQRRSLEFEVDDHVFLKVSPVTGVGRSIKAKKLTPRFMGPYEILERIGPVTYQIALQPHLSYLHDVFHVSQLKKYHPDPSHVIEPEEVEL